MVEETSLRVERRKLLPEESVRNFFEVSIPGEIALGNGRGMILSKRGEHLD